MLPTWRVLSIAAARQRLREISTRLAAIAMDDIDRMSGEQFEDLLADVFAAQGYGVVTTPRTGDYGADLVLELRGGRTAVQVKRLSRPVDQAAVREALGSMAIYSATSAMVVTNNGFTKHATELARVNGVRLWDRGAVATALADGYTRSIELPTVTLEALVGGRIAGLLRR